VQVRHFRRPEEHPLTAGERQRVAILFGGSSGSAKFMEAVFRGSGCRCKTQPNPDLAADHVSREFGNPAQCHPTYFTAGNLIQYKRGLEAHATPPVSAPES